MRSAIVSAVLAAGSLAWGCGSTPAAVPTGTGLAGATASPPRATATRAATPTPPATTSEPPLPRHVTFAPGETIKADGQAGIFFLDPKTGATEGWVVPAPGGNPFAFDKRAMSGDGTRVVYSCTGGCGGDAAHVMYLLDTTSGERTPLDGFTGPLVSLSPDGAILAGQTADRLVLAPVAQPSRARSVSLPPGTDTSFAVVAWSPDSSRFTLEVGRGPRAAFLVTVADAQAKPLEASYAGSWSGDGMRIATARPGRLLVLDRDGNTVWSKSGGGAIWSADGSLLLGVAEERPAAAPTYGPLMRGEVLDAITGRTLYRVRGVACPLDWAGPAHRLLTGTFGRGEAVVDLVSHALKLIDVYARPTPFDASMAIIFDGSDFSSYDIDTGAIKLIARTTVTPAWDENHGALFAGRRIVFTAGHLGHGGCGEGSPPKDPPKPELLAGPFADDAPVTYGPGR